MPVNPQIIFTSAKHAELLEKQFEEEAGDNDIIAKTIVSCVSSGSECGGYSDFFGGNRYPMATGYIGILRVLEIGKNVDEFKPGDIIFARTPHQLYNKIEAKEALRVPPDMPVESAVLARFPAVSMPTLVRTQIKPTEPVLVVGLGIVGLFCAQMMQHCGYEVYAIDIDAARRETASKCGVRHAHASIEETPAYGKYGLGIDCTGGDGAVMAMVKAIRKGGELSLVGVPWRKTSEHNMHQFMYAIFYQFLTVYSGFEWCLPVHEQPFMPNSNYKLFETAMRWINEGRIQVEGAYALRDPRKCDEVYQQISKGQLPTTCAIFDWRSF
jgi:threonine dehydrogenase-like Zn-dependent dehydrogenase